MFYGGMAIRSSGRRRGLALVSIAAVALSISLAIPGMTTSAGANPGNVAIAVNLALVTPTFKITGISTPAPATATITSDGKIVIPKAGIVFAPTAVHIGAPNPEIGDVSVQVVATTDFIGAVDPASHVEWLAGNLEMQWTQPGTMTGCRIGPFTVIATTQSPGSRPYAAVSTAYSAAGTATMVDGNFAIPAVDPNASGCGEWQTSVNAALSLPITTTTTTSSTMTATATTVPTPNTVLTDLVPGTPVPALVVSTTMTPAPQSPTPRTTPTTTHAPTSAPAATTSPPTTPGAAPTQIVPAPTAQPGGRSTTHKTRRTTNPHKRRHPKHRKSPAKPRAVVVLPSAPASSTHGQLGPAYGGGLVGRGRNGRGW